MWGGKLAMCVSSSVPLVKRFSVLSVLISYFGGWWGWCESFSPIAGLFIPPLAKIGISPPKKL